MAIFNPIAAETLENPYPAYHHYREHDPVHWVPLPDGRGGRYFLFRYNDVKAVLKSKDFTQISLHNDGSPLSRMLSKWLVFRNPPDHTWIRSLVVKAFDAKILARVEATVQGVTDLLLDQVQNDGKMDLIRQFASPLPLITVAELLGVSPDDRDLVRKWTTDIINSIEVRPIPQALQKTIVSCQELMSYLGRVIVDRRKSPRPDDLISKLIEAGEHERRLTDEELLCICALLLCAGNETTINLIGNGIFALLQNPQELTRLKEQPQLIGSAVEELLRFDSPVQFLHRQATHAIDIGGKKIPQGAIVVPALGAANRDPEHFPDPDRLDISRNPTNHSAFSMGIHFCLGAHLARHEAKIALSSLITIFPDIQLAPSKPQRVQGASFRGFQSLKITF
ncbi:MAG: pimeloyl-[acyl-carrier protein] synthase [Akkermansiaceae bacterium]|jgi:pimeloyl-[acyl-carrier protein] synthase